MSVYLVNAFGSVLISQMFSFSRKKIQPLWLMCRLCVANLRCMLVLWADTSATETSVKWTSFASRS